MLSYNLLHSFGVMEAQQSFGVWKSQYTPTILKFLLEHFDID